MTTTNVGMQTSFFTDYLPGKPPPEKASPNRPPARAPPPPARPRIMVPCQLPPPPSSSNTIWNPYRTPPHMHHIAHHHSGKQTDCGGGAAGVNTVTRFSGGACSYACTYMYIQCLVW